MGEIPPPSILAIGNFGIFFNDQENGFVGRQWFGNGNKTGHIVDVFGLVGQVGDFVWLITVGLWAIPPIEVLVGIVIN